MNQSIYLRTLSVVVVVVLIVATTLLQNNRTLRASDSQAEARMLEAVAALIKENQSLIQELHSNQFTEKDSGILEAYLAKVRRDGVPKHADMKEKLDQLAENNAAIVALIKAYSPLAKTPAYTAEADKFRNYASAWRDRWNSMMELFMVGGSYAASGVRFPKDFSVAVAGEIAAAK